jgi:hypothetical protein
MPISFNMAGFLAEADLYLYDTPDRGGWGDDKIRWTFSGIFGFAIAKQIDLTLIAQFRTRRNYQESNWQDLYYRLLTAQARYAWNSTVSLPLWPTNFNGGIMKIFIFAIILTAFFGYSGCNTEGKRNNQTITPDGTELSIEPGEHWLGKMKVFIFSVNKTPQMAAWIEDHQGQYVSTITVTNRSAKKDWISAPKEGRPEALPVWNHRIQKNRTQIDGVSAATSKGAIEVQIDNGSLINGSEYNVYLEINHSFDYNAT